MGDEHKVKTSRRQFLKATCGAGVAAAAGASGAWAAAETMAAGAKMPVRPFGKTGVNVPILALGGSLNLMNQQLLLKQALKMGVRYWDTANSYSGGRSEEGIGRYFKNNPDDRKHVFLVSKTSQGDPKGMEADLNGSLERLNTDYVDLYFVHGVAHVDDEMDDATRRWVEKAKAKGRIRFFGFSTHRNMAPCLSRAAELGWIDGIMSTYSYRLVEDPDMKKAMDACERAGIGLVAMKAQGGWSVQRLGRGGDLLQPFLDKGMTKHQAKLKAVWGNPQISSICSHMDDLSILKENVAAAMDRSTLSETDRSLLRHDARETATGYCAGCSDICESVLTAQVPVADVMRCLMYANCYNDYQMAREAVGRLPDNIRERLLETDFSAAEARCPQGMAIGELMRRAAEEINGLQPGKRYTV
jgi:predicted aldo/keto reductase-like oxidoreductase